ncbi:MAG: nucleoside hydrolase [Nitriliruptoraceae bacterium]|nr:nucleoside hydrolase [Nitriliruptoraceae bacterium]
MEPILLDVDTGIDDAIAIVAALRDPRVQLVGIGTVFGNVDVDTATRNTLRVLEVAGAEDVPVAAGTPAPLLEPFQDARWVHGQDGLGDSDQPAPSRRPTDEHAVDQLLRCSREHPGTLTVVAVGPLTNLAVALARDPGLADRLGRIVLMGGGARCGGNRTAWAEANIAADPEAAAIVFAADVERTMIGLDVTHAMTLDDGDVAALRAIDDPVAGLIVQILPHYLDFYAGVRGTRSAIIHDALAVLAAVEPQVVTTQRRVVAVETAGHHTRGMTVVDLRGPADRPVPEDDHRPRTDVGLTADADRCGRWLRDLLGIDASERSVRLTSSDPAG